MENGYRYTLFIVTIGFVGTISDSCFAANRRSPNDEYAEFDQITNRVLSGRNSQQAIDEDFQNKIRGNKKERYGNFDLYETSNEKLDQQRYEAHQRFMKNREEEGKQEALRLELEQQAREEAHLVAMRTLLNTYNRLHAIKTPNYSEIEEEIDKRAQGVADDMRMNLHSKSGAQNLDDFLHQKQKEIDYLGKSKKKRGLLSRFFSRSSSQ